LPLVRAEKNLSETNTLAYFATVTKIKSHTILSLLLSLSPYPNICGQYDKPTSLVRHGINYGCKSFIAFGAYSQNLFNLLKIVRLYDTQHNDFQHLALSITLKVRPTA